MTNNEREPTEVSRSRNGYLWGILAVLSCPCHLPILAIVLAGTSAGAFLGEHWVIVGIALTGLFVLSLSRLLGAFNK
ncbi:broad-spectrum mercury transporter MerE [Limnobacter sp. UBA6514]|uniref:broad-spectrum mercury transporter MerE n=1 Tax=Limnobacter sp. UBA6514 TaxID=1946761 RepID=UPI0025C3E87C|nr:broad-spectrum mercury transporter MerE [Limnobacter sp. UBA6514]|tara:strand:- start:4656 stop:4886 length:231 start_codon:yes stop_codon:yes gene_type:complete